MGSSSHHHQSWLAEALAPIRPSLLTTLPANPVIFGIGEQTLNPVVADLLGEQPYCYQAFDLFPSRPEVKKGDINNLAEISDSSSADIIGIFRTTMFLTDKDTFFSEIQNLLNPGGYLLIDLHIGSAYVPALSYQYGHERVSAQFKGNPPVYYFTTFYDERLLSEFPADLAAFCRHARVWPLHTHASMLRRSPTNYFKSVLQQRGLRPENFAQRIQAITPSHHLITLEDFTRNNLAVRLFTARYFYPQTRKFKLIGFVLAQKT